MALYVIGSSAVQQGTSPFANIATGTAIKSLLQVKAGAARILRICEWGISFNGSAAATPGKVELIESDTAATVTASVAADIEKIDSDAVLLGDPTTAIISVGTTATGYNASSEGAASQTIRLLDGGQLIAPTTQFVRQFPLGDEPAIQPAKFLRIRCLFGTTVDAYAWVKLRA